MKQTTSQEWSISKEPNHYLRGRQQIEFIFCSEYIFTFLDKYDKNLFNEVTSSDIRNLSSTKDSTFFLTESYISLPDYTFYPLKPSNAQSVVDYKKHICNYVTKHHIIEKAKEFQKESINRHITHNNYNSIN